ncbi:unnamed protein product [Microthlaspi erraticum]|uniref:Uncharacterized protein n=1 Tax=Microthlaspi erraticum TaxID=1685480 RepID=A0A6D2KX84_9BRAS|nr:unnamed protein product [Microthlaspi erraticum]
MNAAFKTAISRPQSYFSQLKTALLHSTPVLERKRRSSSSGGPCSSSKSNSNKKKKTKKFLKEHQEKIRRAVEELKREREEAARKAKEEESNRKQGFKSTRKNRQMGYDDKEFDFVFRSLFGVSKGFEYSTCEEEERSWWYNPSWYSSYSGDSWRSKYRFYDKEEEEEEEDEEQEQEQEQEQEKREEQKKEEDSYSSRTSRDSVPDPIQSSHRRTLGLSTWGPLKLEDVKHAWRLKQSSSSALWLINLYSKSYNQLKTFEGRGG